MKVPNDIQQYSDALHALSVRHELLEHPELKTPLEVQSHLGLTLADGLSTMIMKTSKGFITVIRRCDTRLDSKKVKALVGSKLRMATVEEFSEVTGLPAGAARAVVPDLPVYLDEKLMDKQWLVGGSGRFDYSIRYYAQDLVLLAGSRVVDIAD